MVAPVNWSKSPPSFFTAQWASLSRSDRFAAKMGDPVGQSQFDFIAQPGRFMMFGYPRTQHGTRKIDTDQQLNRPGITIWRRSFKNCCNRTVVPAGNIYAVSTFAQRRRIDQITALRQVIIVAIAGQNLIEQCFCCSAACSSMVDLVN